MSRKTFLDVFVRMKLSPPYQLLLKPPTIIRLLFWAVLVLLCLASPVAAKISGEMELSYVDYTIKEDGEEKRSLSSFAQNYSIYYDKQGFIGDKRLGNYDIGLGYQWTANNTDINSEDELDGQNYDSHDGKVLFRGQVTLAPGGLPFRFTAWSFDDSPPTYSTLRTGEILDTQVTVGTRSREEIYSGMTLWAGIRNGSYLGKYRKLLSSMPRLYIDYAQYFIRDVDGLYKEHSLARDLAFVSLNKKDNWFHYRAFDYQDYEDSGNDYGTTSIILGTIDQTLTRQWINMTNWIKLSVDATYTKTDSEKNLESGIDPKTYALNLFTQADYGKTRVANFSNLRRTNDQDKLEQTYEIPIYANGWIDANRSWSMQLNRYYYTEDWSEQELRDDDEDGEYLMGRLGVGHNSAYKFDSKLELERSKVDSVQALAARARQEITSQRSRSPWLLGFVATFIASDGTADDIADEDSSSVGDIFESELYGSYQWAVSPRNVLEFRQNLRYANGVSNDYLSRFISPKGYARTFEGRLQADSSEPLYASETSLELESLLKPNLTNRLRLSVDVYSGGSFDTTDVALIDKLDYRSNRWQFEMMNAFYIGDDPPDETATRDLRVATARSLANPVPNYVLGHSSSLVYSPFRNFRSRTNFDFTLRDTDNGKVYEAYLLERGDYTFFGLSGRRRTLAKVYQEFQYEKYSSDFTTASLMKFTLGASYYPFSTLELGGELSYKKWDPADASSIALSTMAAMTFSQLYCEARYSYGIGKVSNQLYDERTEHLFEAKVRKSF